MIKQVLFDGKVEVAISDISDGNMRFFGGDKTEIIKNQEKLGGTLGLTGEKIARNYSTIPKQTSLPQRNPRYVSGGLGKFEIFLKITNGRRFLKGLRGDCLFFSRFFIFPRTLPFPYFYGLKPLFALIHSPPCGLSWPLVLRFLE